MLFAMNYNSVPKLNPIHEFPAAAMALELKTERSGDYLQATIRLANDRQRVKGLSVEIAFDPSRLVVARVDRGDLFGPVETHQFFHAEPDNHGLTIDGAILGTGAATVASGTLATIFFEDHTGGASDLSFGTVRLRDQNNREIPLQLVANDNGSSAPIGFVLMHNSPNPFRSVTRIHYQIPDDGHITIEVTDVYGKTIATLVDDVRARGMHQVSWDGRDDHGQLAPSAMYIITMRTQNRIAHKRILLQR